MPEGMNDEALEAVLYASRRSKRGHRRVAEPDWASVHRKGEKNFLRPTSAAPRAGSFRYRGAASSRNTWVQSSRYRRSSRDEDCSPPPSQIRTASFSHRAPPEFQPVVSADFALLERVAIGIGNGKIFIKRLNRSHVMPR